LNKKNVLVTGIGQANYILQLYGEISPKLEKFSFNILNIKHFGDDEIVDKAASVFSNTYESKPNLKRFQTILQAFLPVVFNRYFWKDLGVYIVDKGNLISNGGLRLFLRHVNAYYYAKFIEDKTNTHVIHLHFPKHIFALFTKYLKKDYEMIWTYWGSDIFRINSWRDHEIQNSGLHNVNVVTAATPEMEFAILTRFGFQHSYKIKRARFIHDRAFYDIANTLIADRSWEMEFKNSFSIPDNKIIIMMGHNGHFENNHYKFIKTIKSLPNNVLNDFHLIFPFSYGNNKEGYLEKLHDLLKDMPCSFQFVQNFLDWKDLAKLKIVSDVYVHCPTTDGLSAFLTEFLYTGNLAIVGEWLPYKTFKNFGIYYSTFQDFGELKDILSNLKAQLEDSQDSRIKNRDIVARNFDISKITNEWVKIFKELEEDNYHESSSI